MPNPTSASAEPILRIEDLHKSFGPLEVLKGIDYEIDKGEKTNPNAQKVVETIIKFGRQDLLKYYPVALYKGEAVAAENKPAHPMQFKEPLTVELLTKHQKLVKGE